MLFLFRPYQVMGLDRKLFLATFFAHCFDALCRVGLQALNAFGSPAFAAVPLFRFYSVLPYFKHDR